MNIQLLSLGPKTNFRQRRKGPRRREGMRSDINTAGSALPDPAWTFSSIHTGGSDKAGRALFEIRFIIYLASCLSVKFEDAHCAILFIICSTNQ